MSALRVVHVDAGREWRGGQNQVRLLARALAREPGVEQILVTRAGSQLARRALADGVNVAGVPWGPSFDPRAIWGLRRTLRHIRPRIVHAHDSHALAATLAARAVAGRPRPVVVATRRVDFPIGPVSPWRRVDHVIAISAAVRDVLASGGIPRRRLSVIPSGVDPDDVRRNAARPLDVRARLGLAPDAPLAVNVAALVGHKDHDTLIRAAALARAWRPDLHWAIAGAGRLRASLEHAAARQGLAGVVHFLGYIDTADALIREASVLVMSSRAEGLGSVVLHALALGTPVVATRAGGLPEMLPPEALVPVGDADGLARKVVATLADPCAMPVPPRFTATAMAAGVLACYRALA